ncbi:hybrid sensor histidine kinase/response regulator [Leptothermofonsia sp. ETS-13]|uniref:hybrid sensor histidine kinase/response regulator n=1 Tax=Leptothermofonsia sp. ETS-13 TaxID=3035696 RepID=UPI003BA3547F
MPKILVIEDEQPVRINIVAMLKAEGFQVILAEDGQIGVQLAQEHIPDLIICDITMPQLDGFGVLEVLQQTPTTSTIPFIFLSAKSERSDFRRGMNLGADDYLTKPFTRTELLEAICTRLTKQSAVMELKQKLEEIQQSNLLKDDFVSTVAHELRSPLMTMKMAIQLLQTTQDTKRHVTYLEVLQAACNHEVELIDNLLDLQRLEARTWQDEAELIDLRTWVPGIVEPIRMRAQQRQQIVQIEICPDLSPVRANQFGLERIITELFTNACKYTPPGGKICLKLFAGNSSSMKAEFGSTTLSQIFTAQRITIESTAFCFMLSNEAEIPANAIPHLFERFYRVPKSDRWQQGGTGLGLSLVKKFVEQMHGSIYVHSANGWAHFIVQLPIKR